MFKNAKYKNLDNSLRNENIPVKVDMAWQWGEEAAVRKSGNQGSPALSTNHSALIIQFFFSLVGGRNTFYLGRR